MFIFIYFDVIDNDTSVLIVLWLYQKTFQRVIFLLVGFFTGLLNSIKIYGVNGKIFPLKNKRSIYSEHIFIREK